MPIHLLESNLFWFDDGGHWVCLRSCLIAFVKRCFSRMKISSMLQNCPYIYLATEHFSRRFFYITSCIVSQAKSSMLRRHFIMPRLKYHKFEDFWITRCCYYAELHIYELNRQKCAALHICRDIFAREKRVKGWKRWTSMYEMMWKNMVFERGTASSSPFRYMYQCLHWAKCLC